jgi:5-methylcytosine-specific restriction enzyme A
MNKYKTYSQLKRNGSKPRYNRPKFNKTEWAKIRIAFLSTHILCEDCILDGLITPAVEVHHIKARRDGGNDDYANLMALCKRHHSKRTIKEVRGDDKLLD